MKFLVPNPDGALAFHAIEHDILRAAALPDPVVEACFRIVPHGGEIQPAGERVLSGLFLHFGGQHDHLLAHEALFDFLNLYVLLGHTQYERVL